VVVVIDWVGLLVLGVVGCMGFGLSKRSGLLFSSG
jgi:hypothetical protein